MKRLLTHTIKNAKDGRQNSNRKQHVANENSARTEQYQNGRRWSLQGCVVVVIVNKKINVILIQISNTSLRIHEILSLVPIQFNCISFHINRKFK